MNSKEALERLSNVEVSVTSIRSRMTYFKTLKEQYEKEFEVLEKELFVRDIIKPFDVYEEQYKQLEKKYENLEKVIEILKDKFKFELGVVVIKEKYYYSLEFVEHGYFTITKEQYELLKEVLEDD